MTPTTPASDPACPGISAPKPAAGLPPRLVSLDAYRGFIMLILAADGFGLARAAQAHPDSPLWRFLGQQFEHVEWRGCGLWDLIQPSFMFMVGVAIFFWCICWWMHRRRIFLRI